MHMSRELDILSREFARKTVIVLRSDHSLYQNDLVRDATKFLRDVERTAKKEKSGKVVLVAVVEE